MATHVGLLHLEISVPGAESLKDKRRVIKSFKTRVGNDFNVSVAEVDALDEHRRAVLAVAMVGSDQRYVEGALQQLVNMAAMQRDMVLMDSEVAWL